MVVALAALSLLLGGALVFVVVNSRRERETTARLVQTVITEGTKEREAARKERQELLNRKAMGDKVPIFDLPEGERQSLPFESDEAFWEYKSGLTNGDN